MDATFEAIRFEVRGEKAVPERAGGKAKRRN